MSIVIYTELYSSKNHKQIFKNKKGNLFIAKPNKAMRAEQSLKAMLLQVKPQWNAMRMMAGDPPWIVELKIFRRTRVRFDYVNIVQQLFDCMTAVGMLPDDCADYVIPQFLPYEVDKTNPRVEITIRRAS